jgi:flagellar biosynthesis/type III secretory pathway M-ring protein FliF/YscJ
MKKPITYIIINALSIAIVLIYAACISGCASTKSMDKMEASENNTTQTSGETSQTSQTSNTEVDQHTTTETESGTEIQFGAGGGTYNDKTGEATNVTNVKTNNKTREQEDIIFKQNTTIETLQARCDSLSSQVSTYQRELSEEKERPKRTEYDRFCSRWFWISAIILLIKIAAWVMEKFPATAPYVLLARKFVPIL